MDELIEEKTENELERVLAKDNATSMFGVYAPDAAATVKIWR